MTAKNKLEKHQTSPHEQLKRLDFRLGVGVGAAKERSKLKKMIEDANVGKKKEKEEVK